MAKKRVTKKSPFADNLFRSSPEWCVLDDVHLSTIEENAICSSYDTGDIIFYEGDEVEGVYFIKSGLVGIRKADFEGNSTLLKIANPGDTLGYRPLAAEQPHRASAEVLKPSIICFIDAKTIRHILQCNPVLGLNFLKKAAQELGDAEEKFHESVTLSTRARFAHLLIVMQDKLGHEAEDGSQQFTLPVSRSDLADMLGVRRESISRVIHELDSLGITEITERNVVVPNPESLMSVFHA